MLLLLFSSGRFSSKLPEKYFLLLLNSFQSCSFYCVPLPHCNSVHFPNFQKRVVDACSMYLLLCQLQTCFINGVRKVCTGLSEYGVYLQLESIFRSYFLKESMKIALGSTQKSVLKNHPKLKSGLLVFSHEKC